MVSSQKFAMLAAVCTTSFAAAVAHAQLEGEADTPQPRVSADDTVIVQGMAPDTLRTMIEEAEEAVYARFNEINSDDQFDVFCFDRVELGSRMLHRVCQPNFLIKTSSTGGEETARALASAGGPSFNSQASLAEAHSKGLLFTAEMQRLTAEDEELWAATLRLANLEQSLETGEGSGRAASETAGREVTPDRDIVAVESEADAVFEVRMGREPWSHELSSKTFTIARVYGKVRDLKVTCEEQELELEFEVGVEWTLPDSWSTCTVIVNAKRDTTFALYEFN